MSSERPGWIKTSECRPNKNIAIEGVYEFSDGQSVNTILKYHGSEDWYYNDPSDVRLIRGPDWWRYLSGPVRT